MSEMNNKEFLSWVRDRLEFRHGENPRIDYMIRLKQIVDDMDGDKREIPPCPDGVIVNEIPFRLNRDNAIKWVQVTFQGRWPDHIINVPYPIGWKWIFKRLPYRSNSEYFLESIKDNSILTEKDIYSEQG